MYQILTTPVCQVYRDRYAEDWATIRTVLNKLAYLSVIFSSSDMHSEGQMNT